MGRKREMYGVGTLKANIIASLDIMGHMKLNEIFI